jgi:cold shock CspA family protein
VNTPARGYAAALAWAHNRCLRGAQSHLGRALPRSTESSRGARHRQVVQHPERLWLHPSRWRGRDVFVRISAVERSGLSTLQEGQKIAFEVETGRDGKTSAENLKILDQGRQDTSWRPRGHTTVRGPGHVPSAAPDLDEVRKRKGPLTRLPSAQRLIGLHARRTRPTIRSNIKLPGWRRRRFPRSIPCRDQG